MTFENDINELLNIDIDGWTYHGDTDLDYDANVWFAHTPSEDRPPGLPISWNDLERLNEEYGVVEIESNSNGRTGSKLCVRLKDI
jgi:hypothetical protein